MEEPCSPFLVQVFEHGSAASPAVVCVSGEVDLATAPEMEIVLLNVLNVETAHLIIDMTSVSFIDCFGLGVLVGVANAAHVFGGSLALRSPSRQVCRVRGLIGLDGNLPTESHAGEWRKRA
jgi:anti-anti-sigma factor